MALSATTIRSADRTDTMRPRDELPQRVYDPDKAKFHLKQAGLDSLSVDLSAADAAFAGAVDAAVAL